MDEVVLDLINFWCNDHCGLGIVLLRLDLTCRSCTLSSLAVRHVLQCTTSMDDVLILEFTSWYMRSCIPVKVVSELGPRALL